MVAEEILGFLSDWSVILPLVLGMLYFNRLLYSSKIVLVIVFLATIPQLMNAFHVKNEIVKNVTYNIYTPVEFLLFYLIFNKLIFGRAEKMILKTSAVIYVISSLIFICSNNLGYRFLDDWVCVNNLIYTIWIMMVFYQQYNLSNTLKVDANTSLFWILTGLLLYAPFSSLYFSIYYYAQQPGFASLKSIHHIVNTIMYVCFAIGLYKDGFKKVYKYRDTKDKQDSIDVIAN